MILHLPGHNPGPLGIRDPENAAAIIMGAALETSIYEMEGNRLIPPRYFDEPRHHATIRDFRTLRPEQLLTAHYPPTRSEEATVFLDRLPDFMERLHRVVSEGPGSETTDLRELTERAAARPLPGVRS